MKDPRTSRPGTKRRIIADACNSGETKRELYARLRDDVLAGRMVFSANVNGRRVPKGTGDQLEDLKHEIGRVYAYLGRSKGSRFEDEEIPREDDSRSREESKREDDSTETEIPEDEEEDEDQEDEDDSQESEEDSRPRAKGKRNLREEWSYFKSRLREIRKFCIDRERMSEHVDHISMRPMFAAGKLIAAGIPADVLLLSMAMHWSPNTRGDAGIDTFDFNAEGAYTPHPGMVEVSRRVMREREIDPTGKHALFGYVLLLIENRVPVMLIGPAGTGKSHITEQVADYLGMKYGETPMSSGVSRSDLLGRHTINAERPFVPAEFPERYENGGVFSFEEIDRGDPSAMIVLHNALARNSLFNSINGEIHEKSEDFAAVSTANTFGLGANRQASTAERMDSATIDRFRMGRVFMPIDETLEENVGDDIFNASLGR